MAVGWADWSVYTTCNHELLHGRGMLAGGKGILMFDEPTYISIFLRSPLVLPFGLAESCHILLDYILYLYSYLTTLLTSFTL